MYRGEKCLILSLKRLHELSKAAADRGDKCLMACMAMMANILSACISCTLH